MFESGSLYIALDVPITYYVDEAQQNSQKSTCLSLLNVLGLKVCSTVPGSLLSLLDPKKYLGQQIT